VGSLVYEQGRIAAPVNLQMNAMKAMMKKKLDIKDTEEVGPSEWVKEKMRLPSRSG